VIHVVASIVLAVLYVGTGAGKVLGLGYARKQQKAIRVSPLFWRITGSLEWLGAVGLVVGLWVRPIGVAAASGLALFMIGAAVARIRASRLWGNTRGLASGVAIDLVLFLVCAATAVLIALGL
jgi:uncharacterized membrane protein YphA (DoxX/SURF4 family)